MGHTRSVYSVLHLEKRKSRELSISHLSILYLKSRRNAQAFISQTKNAKIVSFQWILITKWKRYAKRVTNLILKECVINAFLKQLYCKDKSIDILIIFRSWILDNFSNSWVHGKINIVWNKRWPSYMAIIQRTQTIQMEWE